DAGEGAGRRDIRQDSAAHQALRSLDAAADGRRRRRRQHPPPGEEAARSARAVGNTFSSRGRLTRTRLAAALGTERAARNRIRTDSVGGDRSREGIHATPAAAEHRDAPWAAGSVCCLLHQRDYSCATGCFLATSTAVSRAESCEGCVRLATGGLLGAAWG